MVQAHHGGDIYGNQVQYDFSVNLNPLGMPPGVIQTLREHAGDWGCYPDPECRKLAEGLSRVHQIPRDFLLCGNGAADLIFQLVQALTPRRALVLAPTFSEYRRALEAIGCIPDEILPSGHPAEHGWRHSPASLAPCLREASDPWDLVFFCNPGNPTGALASAEELEPLLSQCQRQKIFLVVDECFCGLVEHPEQASVIRLTERYDHLVVLRAFTKTYAMAGLRLGYVVTGNRALLARMQTLRQPWSISLPAQQAGIAALRETAYLEESRRMIARERPWLERQLTALGFSVFPSVANYLLFQTPYTDSPGDLWQTLLSQGILIRSCASFTGLGPDYYRICVSSREKNQILIKALETFSRAYPAGTNTQNQHANQHTKPTHRKDAPT